MLITFLRTISRLLPLDINQKKRIAYLLFDLAGKRFQHLTSYALYERDKKWLKAKIPADLPNYRIRVIDTYFRSPQKTLLMVTHGLGGGTQQHVDDISVRMEKEGWRVLQLQRHNQDYLRLVTPNFAEGEPLFYRWPEEIPALIADLQTLHTTHLHLHHTVDLPEDFLPQFYEIASVLNLPFDFTVHDYFSICPRFTLFDQAVHGYCGEPVDVEKCTACVKYQGSAVGKDIDVATWRQRYGEMLRKARKVFVPDTDVGQRLQHYFPDVTFQAMPHPDFSTLNNLAAPYHNGQTLKLVTIGGIAPHKGSKVLYDCAIDALKRGLPLEFHLIGYSDIDHKLKSLKNVTVSGHFHPHELTEKLREKKCHLGFIPSVIPETYNYTLSECWRHGLYTVGLDIGAIASRIKAAPELGKVLPYEWYLTPEKINDALMQIIPPTLQETDIKAALRNYENFTRDYYNL